MEYLELSRKDEEIRRLAAECRAKAEFEGDRIKIIKLARDLGLKVIQNGSLADSPKVQIKDTENGKFYYDGKQGFVIYDETRTSEQKEFTLAHEIGHYMLRHWETLSTLEWIIELTRDLHGINAEREANLFAEYLLGKCSPYVSESVKG